MITVQINFLGTSQNYNFEIAYNLISDFLKTIKYYFEIKFLQDKDKSLRF